MYLNIAAMKLILPFLHATLVSAGCYEPNVAHPAPDYDVKDAVLVAAFEHLNDALTAAVSAPEFADTSFSVEVTSSEGSLWSLHHTARERNSSRPDIPQVNGDALYRIASITKAFTVLGILYQHAAGKLNLDDPVDTYIEELRGEQEGSIPWKDITLRSLASQLSGIPREFAQGDLINRSFQPYPPEDLGLPPVSRDGLPKCGEYRNNYEPACTKSDLIKTVKSKDPIFAPNQKSTYSNIAFELLGLVIENTTNQTYESYIHGAIFKPLGMTKSTLSLPPDSAGVIPPEPQYWDVDEGIQSPTGGIYSSSTDLSKFLRYILTHFNGITPALNWAHPTSPAEGLNSFYGTPWEIFHTDKILQDSRRTVRFITKSGGLPGYTSVIMTIPEYDLGITILVAGKGQKLFFEIQEIVTVTVVRAAEHIAITQLQKRYAGTYVSTQPKLNSSLTLFADHRGLVVTEFVSNSTDILNSVIPGLAGAPKDQPWHAQLVPTLLYRNETQHQGEKWRLLFVRERDGKDRGIWEDFCPTNIDLGGYANEALNEFVFWQGDGKSDSFNSVELSGFRVDLERKKDKTSLEHGNLRQYVMEL